MSTKVFRLTDSQLFKRKALQWAVLHDPCCYLDSHGYQDPHGRFDTWIGVGSLASWKGYSGQEAWKRLQEFLDAHPAHFLPGYLGYDLKNEIEDLQTRQPNRTGFADAAFFLPAVTIKINHQEVEIDSESPDAIFEAIETTLLQHPSINFTGTLQHRMSKSDYFTAFSRLQDHIVRGDCYEINLCQEFYAENAKLDPYAAYLHLKDVSPTPFSGYLRIGNHYVIGASPERFLSKKGTVLRSQPIKGTAPRWEDPLTDKAQARQLQEDPKERSENIMIVDLVRNDLTKAALPGTVKTTELAEVYSFKHVHQLISTIEAQADPEQNQTSILRHCFPPGSMTGAPKISAMIRIEEAESSRRNVYSGAFGYFAPGGDFDFNVVIRSLLYNEASGYVSFHTGGAITAKAQAEAEYEECLLKGKAIFGILSPTKSV